MPYLTFAELCASRWNALLVENSILHQEHADLLSSFKAPFSHNQIAQIEACAARRAKLTRKLQVLVDEWTRGALRRRE
jgi:hypothetical protein